MSGLLQYRLVVVDPDGAPFTPGDTSIGDDHFWITSRRRVDHPWIQAPPNGEGQKIDLLTGKTSDGQYNVRVIDVPEPICTDFSSVVLIEALGSDYLTTGGWTIGGFEPDPGWNQTIKSWWQPTNPLFGGSALFFWLDTTSPPATLGPWVRESYIFKTYSGLTPGQSYGVKVTGSWSLDTGAGNIFIEINGNRVVFPSGAYSFYDMDGALSANIIDSALTAQADASGEITISMGGTGYAPSCNVTCGFSSVEIRECTPPAPGIGSGPRYVTGWLADADARQQLLGRSAFLEQSLDDGTSWTMLLAGYVTSLQMQDSLVYEFAIGDTRRVERTRAAWRDVAPTTEAITQKMTALIGGPVYTGFEPHSPTFAVPMFRIVDYAAPSGMLPNTAPSDGWVRLNYISGAMPPGFTHPGTNHSANLAFVTINDRAQPFFDAQESYDTTRPSGAFPGLRATLFSDADGSVVVDNMTPLGQEFVRVVITGGSGIPGTNPRDVELQRGQEFINSGLEVVLAVPYTAPSLSIGDYYYLLITPRQISDKFPLFLRGHPVDLEAALLARHGVPVDSTSVTNTKAALGADLVTGLTYSDPAETVQSVVDPLHAAFGYATRINGVGAREFFVWRAFIDTTPTRSIGTNDLRKEGGPTYALDEDSRRNRVVVTQRLFRTISFSDERIIDTPSAIEAVDATQTFDYSTDGGATLDADVTGPADVTYKLPGFVAWGADGQTAGDFGASPPMQQQQWGAGLARFIFAATARGTQEATVVTLRDAADADAAVIGDPIALNAAHVPNAQLAQTPTSQRGGARWWRVVQRSESPEGATLALADGGTGVAYGSTVSLTVGPDDYDPGYFVKVAIAGSTQLETDGAWLEVECALGINVPTGAGVRYTILDGRQMVDASNLVVDPFIQRLGPFPYQVPVWVRARPFLVGGTPAAWSAWTSTGGPSTSPPVAGIYNLQLQAYSATVIKVGWGNTDLTYDVRISWRTNNVGAWTLGSQEPPGTTLFYQTGLAPGTLYGIKVALWDGAAEIGTILTGTATTPLGGITGLVLGTPTSDGVDLSWTNSDPRFSVKVQTSISGTGIWARAVILTPGSDRFTLTGLNPATNYTVRVILVDSSGAEYGLPLTDTFTTAIISGTLGAPTAIYEVAGIDPATGLALPGGYGARVLANSANPIHRIVFEVAVETAAGSGTPGTYAEAQDTTAVSLPGYTDFVAIAPNDGRIRYMRALSRASGYNDSGYTSVVSVLPWSVVVSPPPVIGHHTTHENGGSDEIDVTGLSGRLADPQDADALNSNPVNAPTPSDQDVLTWDAGAGEWIAQAASGGGGGGTRVVGATFDGGATALDLLGATECVIQVPASGTIASYTIVTKGGTGSVSIGVQKSTYSGFPTTSDITGGAHANVSSSTKATDSTLSGWTTTVTAGDVFRFVLRSVSTFTHVTITLTYA